MYLIDVFHLLCIDQIEVKECFYEKGKDIKYKLHPSLEENPILTQGIMYNPGNSYYFTIYLSPLITERCLYPKTQYDK